MVNGDVNVRVNTLRSVMGVAQVGWRWKTLSVMSNNDKRTLKYLPFFKSEKTVMSEKAI